MPSYEEQQKELRKIQGLDDEEEDLEVKPQKDPEVNPEVYRDVEPYLFRGFLTQAADVNGVLVVFKTVNHHEHELIRLSGGYGETGGPTSQFWNRFLSYSVLMVDGVNVLPERDTLALRFNDLFREFQSAAKVRVIRYLSELNRRATKAVALTECYVMERYSRYRWYQVQGLDLTSTSLTGIPGTQILGMNWAQLIWRALNHIEDIRESLESDWEHAKFIGSCSGNKGVRKIYKQDERRKKQEKSERVSKKDAILKNILLGEPLRDGTLIKDGAVWVAAHTNEDLIEQMSRDLKDEKDLHDKLVESFENKVREQSDIRNRQVQIVRSRRDEEFQGRQVIGGTNMQGLTRDQVEAQVQYRRVLQKQKVAEILEETESKVPVEHRDMSQVRPVPMRSRPVGSPFRRG